MFDVKTFGSADGMWLQNDADEEVDEVVKCSIPTAPAVFRWTGEGQEVFLAGSFDNWSSRIRMVKRLISDADCVA